MATQPQGLTLEQKQALARARAKAAAQKAGAMPSVAPGMATPASAPTVGAGLMAASGGNRAMVNTGGDPLAPVDPVNQAMLAQQRDREMEARRAQQVADAHAQYQAREAQAASEKFNAGYRDSLSPIDRMRYDVSNTVRGAAAAVENATIGQIPGSAQAADFIQSQVTPAAQAFGQMIEGPSGRFGGVPGALAGGLTEWGATTARDPRQGLTEANQVLNPTIPLSEGYNQLVDASGDLIDGVRPDTGQKAIQGATNLAIGAMGMAPGGSLTVDAMRAPAQAERAAMAAQRARVLADEIPPARAPQPAPQPSVAPIPQPTVSNAPRRAAQPAAPGAGQGAPATLQATPTAAPGAAPALANSDRKIIGRLLRAGGVPRNDVDRVLSGLVVAHQSSNSARLPLAFFAEEYLPTVLPKQTADDVIQKLRGFGRERYGANDPRDPSRSIVRNTINELRGSQRETLTNQFEGLLGKETLMTKQGKIARDKQGVAEAVYAEEIGRQQRLLAEGSAAPEQVAARDDLLGFMSRKDYFDQIPPEVKLKAADEGKDLWEYVHTNPLEAAHWLQSQLGVLARKGNTIAEAMRMPVVRRLEDSVPGYRGARMEYGDLSGQQAALEFGDDLYRVGGSKFATDQKALEFKKLSRAQKTVAKKSIRDKLLNEFRKAKTGDDQAAVITAMQKDGVLDALETILGPEGKKVADSIRGMVRENERLRAIDLQSGSNTADNLAQMRAAQEAVRSPVNRAVGSIGDESSYARTVFADAVSVALGLPPVWTAGKVGAGVVGKFGAPSKRKLASATRTLYNLPRTAGASAPEAAPRRAPSRSTPRRQIEAPTQENLDALLKQYDQTPTPALRNKIIAMRKKMNLPARTGDEGFAGVTPMATLAGGAGGYLGAQDLNGDGTVDAGERAAFTALGLGGGYLGGRALSGKGGPKRARNALASGAGPRNAPVQTVTQPVQTTKMQVSELRTKNGSVPVEAEVFPDRGAVVMSPKWPSYDAMQLEDAISRQRGRLPTSLDRWESFAKRNPQEAAMLESDIAAEFNKLAKSGQAPAYNLALFEDYNGKNIVDMVRKAKGDNQVVLRTKDGGDVAVVDRKWLAENTDRYPRMTWEPVNDRWPLRQGENYHIIPRGDRFVVIDDASKEVSGGLEFTSRRDALGWLRSETSAFNDGPSPTRSQSARAANDAAPPPASAPKPPPVKNGFGSSKLPMDEASRMQRAREQGFDVDTPLYHGTNKSFDEFDPSKAVDGTYGRGVYLATDPAWAKEFTGASGKVLKVVARQGRQFDIYAPTNSLAKQYSDLYARVGKDPTKAIRLLRDGWNREAFRQAERDLGQFSDLGFDSLRGVGQQGDEIVIFDPANIRRTDAAFDPSQSGSSKLLAGMADNATGYGTAGGAIAGGTFARDTNGDGVVDANERAYGALGGAITVGIAGKAVGAGARRMGKAPPMRNALRRGPDQATFGGVNAKTADRVALARAQQMEASGADRNAIWDETGWFKGVDGKWRFEIDDSKSAVTEPVRHGQRYYLNENYGANDLKASFDHPEAFTAYPDTPKIKAGNMMDDFAAYHPEEDLITLPGTAKDPRSVILHENQHAIQTREGFAHGGAPENFMQQKDAELARDAMNWRKEVAAKRREMPQADWIAIENELVQDYRKNGIMDWLPSDQARNLARDTYNNPDDQLQKLIEVYGLDKAVSTSSPREMYRRLAGETEARNVQTRRDFTPEQRRAKRPWETQDVPDDQQIVRFGGGKAESRKPPVQNGFSGSKPPPAKGPPKPPGYGKVRLAPGVEVLPPDRNATKANPRKAGKAYPMPPAESAEIMAARKELRDAKAANTRARNRFVMRDNREELWAEADAREARAMDNLNRLLEEQAAKRQKAGRARDAYHSVKDFVYSERGGLTAGVAATGLTLAGLAGLSLAMGGEQKKTKGVLAPTDPAYFMSNLKNNKDNLAAVQGALVDAGLLADGDDDGTYGKRTGDAIQAWLSRQPDRNPNLPLQEYEVPALLAEAYGGYQDADGKWYYDDGQPIRFPVPNTRGNMADRTLTPAEIRRLKFEERMRKQKAAAQ